MVARKRDSKECKLDAINLVIDPGYTRIEAARNLGIQANMLGRWVQEQQADDGQAFRGNGKLTPEQDEFSGVTTRHPLKRYRMCCTTTECSTTAIGCIRI